MIEYSVFDIETDGLIDEVTKIHCLSYQKYKDGILIEKNSLTESKDIIDFIINAKVLIGHNIVRYDLPVIKKLLGISPKGTVIDTLGLSWYLFPNMLKHNLEFWGEVLGVAKPVINDWTNLSISEYIHRCETDVVINSKLWMDRVLPYLVKLYGENYNRIIGYITFKLDCAREQEEVKWKLDVELCIKTLTELVTQKEMKEDILTESMPLVPIYKKANKPKVMYKKDGSLSEAGKKWITILNENNLPLDHEQTVLVEIDRDKGNSNSTSQIKNWLYSLGWVPCTFNYVKNKETGETKAIPQIYNSDGVTPSVKLLYEKEPLLENLDGLTVINHRIGILKGFLKNKDKNDFLKAEIIGFTNTMRFQHTVIVNLPTVHKPYGKQIRGCLISPDENHVLCGSDMASLEDNTKQHYMYFYDPEYVREMRVPGFDPHLDIAVQGKMLTPQQVQAHKDGLEDHSKIRKDAKVVNFSAVYGVGAAKMSLGTGWPIEKSTELLKIYWQRNWSVKKIANNTKHITIDGQMWLWNPVSQFWYSLRYEKDKFSTLNQGTGVYCFDSWIRNVRKRGATICGQFHDEIISPTLKGKEEEKRKLLRDALDETNNELKLNIDLGISIDFGDNYAQIH